MASFNEGCFEDVKVDNQVSGEKNTLESETETPTNFDISTSSYLFDLAIEKNNDTEFKHGVIERHKHFHIGGVHPLPTYSLRFGTVNDDISGSGEQPARLWAQRHIIAKEPYYVISTSPFDMNAKKAERTNFFLGKLKESHGARCFTGYTCAKDKAVPLPTACIIYDHERVAGENKMEVGIPLSSPDTDDPSSPTLEQDFYKVRREGSQNHAPSGCPVMCFHQRDCDSEVMGSESILQKFVIDGSACATRTSTKNFQLIKSNASRRNMLPPVANEQQERGEDLEDTVVLQMGKVADDIFSCAYKGPFTFLQVFMICLSRFETKQAY